MPQGDGIGREDKLFSLIKKAFKRNKAIHVTLLLFLILSTRLLSSATIIALRLVDSISNLYEIARPPHFLQMHKGDYNQEEIDRFVSKAEDIIGEQTIEMVGIDGGDIWITTQNDRRAVYSLSDSMIDNCFVIQNGTHSLVMNVKERINVASKTNTYREIMPVGAKVKPMEEVVSQTMGGMSKYKRHKKL